ncbi:NAD(P)H-dependent oxidoreductase [Sulfitobacter sp. F26204]|uniref:NADPH-dependent FMN reductase n=1 Tax=Sulfitobacter sp. F26204 TaxID=2996014 RepID=UPI00225E546D|nr:NADPH-dependent FMN reductase [Sulfitobacter sp. F26204]MCX7558490.1 NAD(P)H-dependent oxidoreductase [Sulfitobacter sp. F26204]
MTSPKLLAISGSLRAEATNTKLMREAARLFGDHEYTEADIAFPLYDADDEVAQGVPKKVQKVAAQIAAADAVIISTPEYNKGPSGVLKNALDWISRVEGNPWNDKPVAVMSAAAGRAGGERAQMVLRGFMVPFRPRILQGPEIHLAASSQAFDENGHLTGEIYVKELTALMVALRRMI